MGEGDEFKATIPKGGRGTVVDEDEDGDPVVTWYGAREVAAQAIDIQHVRPTEFEGSRLPGEDPDAVLSQLETRDTVPGWCLPPQKEQKPVYPFQVACKHQAGANYF